MQRSISRSSLVYLAQVTSGRTICYCRTFTSSSRRRLEESLSEPIELNRDDTTTYAATLARKRKAEWKRTQEVKFHF